MSFVILVGKEGYQTAECGKTNIKIPHKSYYDGKHKIVDKSILVVFEEEAAHKCKILYLTQNSSKY